jgi:hypothetical protein
MFHTPTAIFQVDKLKHFENLIFKWQLSFLTLDINVKFNFKATFINILYAYFQPFCIYIF